MRLRGRALRDGRSGRSGSRTTPWSWLLPALVGAALLAATGEVGAQDHEWVGARKCRSCHKKEKIGNQFGVWQDGPHAKAYESLASDKAKEYAAEKGIDDPQKADECLKCHVSAHGVSDDMVSRKFDRTAGVQCESCHGPGKDYRKKKVMVDEELAISKGLIIPKAENCTECHNDESPAWDPDKYTLADGSKTGFDFEQASEKIAHPVPDDYDPEADSDEEDEDD